MSAIEDLTRMANWLEHAGGEGEDDRGEPICNPEECHKCIALRVIAELAQAKNECPNCAFCAVCGLNHPFQGVAE